MKQLLKKAGSTGRRVYTTVERVHAAELGLGHIQYGSTGIEGTAAASRVGRSFASVPSCMPCMSFLAFGAFFV